MGSKGRKRREKNYRSAHGLLHSRLPPPPNPSQIDALPSKLRKIISFSHPPSQSHTNKKPRSKTPAEDVITSKATAVVYDKSKATTANEVGVDAFDEEPAINNKNDNNDQTVNKKKRKRKQVKDLRFELGLGDTKPNAKRKERKKKYLEAKKMKHKKSKADENLDFPGYEKIKFGDVVLAPPKLVTLPKVQKNFQTASQERLRMKAIEAYRNHKGWTSRPGLQLPSTPSSS